MLTIEEAAAHLGVHYMTVYRYIRTGRLAGTYGDGRWHIDPKELDRLAARRNQNTTQGRGARRPPPARMEERLLAGDATGAWSIAEAALLSGSPADVHLGLLAPALARVGEGWESGRLSVADEHRATAVAFAVLGRLSPLFARPGRRRPGPVLLAGVQGDSHALPVIMVGDILRGAGFEVIQLGADVPVDSLTEMAASTGPVAVGLSASTDRSVSRAATEITHLHRRLPGVPVLLGGPAVVDEGTAQAAGADGWAADGAAVAGALAQLAVSG